MAPLRAGGHEADVQVCARDGHLASCVYSLELLSAGLTDPERAVAGWGPCLGNTRSDIIDAFFRRPES